jgi:hypothetical protein
VWRSKSGAQSKAQRFSPVGSSMRQMCDGTMLGMPTRDGLRGTGVRSSAFPMPGGSQQGQQGSKASRDHGFRGLHIGGDKRFWPVGPEESGSGGLLHFSPARVPPSDMGMGRGRGRVRVGILRSRRCDRQEAERAHYLFQNKTEGGQTGPLSISNLSPDLARTPLLTAALVLGTLSTVYT